MPLHWLTMRNQRDLRLFILANIFIAFGSCVEMGAFNNYLRETFALGVEARTFLEFPRETPGFLVSLFIGILYALGDVRIAALANILAGIGMFALGIIPPVYGLMLASVFVYSSGIHIFMPLNSSIGMEFAGEERLGRMLGKISAANTAALVGGSLALMLAFALLRPSFGAVFAAGAASYLASAACLLLMEPRKRAPGEGKRFVLRKRYGLFYGLSALYGARKQLFITFGPWVIVDVFAQGASVMSFLFLVVSVIGIGAKPLIGRFIDARGERFVLGAEALLLVGVCAAYALAPGILPRGAALVVVCGCYVLDQVSNSASMARATYLRKIALKPEEVSPTLSLGVSIDHVASMLIPMLGGLAWRAAGPDGYRWVFASGALIALANFSLSRAIPRDRSSKLA